MQSAGAAIDRGTRKALSFSQVARRGISQVAAHPPVSVRDSGMRQSDLASVHTSLFDDKKGGGNADGTSLALIQEEEDLDTGACST